MSMILELPKDIEAALAFQAQAAQMPTEQYLANLVKHAVENRRRIAAEQLRQHLDGMASKVSSDTTSEQMESAFEQALDAIRPRRDW